MSGSHDGDGSDRGRGDAKLDPYLPWSSRSRRTHDMMMTAMREGPREGQRGHGFGRRVARKGIFSHDETNKDGQRTEEEEEEAL